MIDIKRPERTDEQKLKLAALIAIAFVGAPSIKLIDTAKGKA